MKRFNMNIKKALICLTVSAYFSTVYAQVTNSSVECYTRTYDESHFAKLGNEKQTLQKLNLKIINSDDNKVIVVEAWKRHDKNKKNFSATLSLVAKQKGHQVYCDTANGEVDGNHARGCLKINNSKVDNKLQVSR